MKYIYLFSMLCLLLACERQEDVDLKVPYKRKLVPAVFIGAGDAEVIASVQYTSPVFGAVPLIDGEMTGSANGTLIYGGKQTQFIFDSIDKRYTANISPDLIEAGNTFEVLFTDGKEQTKGKTVIPQPVTLDVRVAFDSVFINGELTQYYGSFTSTLTSLFPAYVKIQPLLIMNDSITSIPMYNVQYVPITLLNPGQSFTAKFIAASSINGLYPARINCLVISCDEAYAKYANATQNIDFSNTLPGSEPSLVYSNMSNNIGIIASYNICELKDVSLK